MTAADRSHRHESELTFSVLVRELAATYREQPRAFHVVAARYYLGVESGEELRRRAHAHICITDGPQTGYSGNVYARPELSEAQVQAIIDNR